MGQQRDNHGCGRRVHAAAASVGLRRRVSNKRCPSCRCPPSLTPPHVVAAATGPAQSSGVEEQHRELQLESTQCCQISLSQYHTISLSRYHTTSLSRYYTTSLSRYHYQLVMVPHNLHVTISHNQPVQNFRHIARPPSPDHHYDRATSRQGRHQTNVLTNGLLHATMARMARRLCWP